MENNKPLYGWRDYLVIMIIGIIFSLFFISYMEPKSKNSIIYHPDRKSPFEKYEYPWSG